MTLFKICKRPCFAGLTFKNRSQVGGNRIGNPKHFKISEAEHLENMYSLNIPMGMKVR